MISYFVDAASSTATMVSIICNIIFFALFFLIALWGLIGFVKGFYKSTWSFLYLYIGKIIIFLGIIINNLNLKLVGA